MVISLWRMRKFWFWVKILAIVIVLALILPPVIGWVRHLMYSAATSPPETEEVLTPGGSEYGGGQGGCLGGLLRF